MNRRILFYVQHLLGIGHLKRAFTLAGAMAERGLEVTVVSGGDDVPVLERKGAEFVQLAPIRAADRTFSSIVGPDGEEIDEVIKAARRDKLLDVFAALQPAAVMIELFPFGRRALRFELLPLIEAARATRPEPLIVSSVRDVLVEKNRPERVVEMVATAKALFDQILVHGDPDFIAFDATFPRADELNNIINYTGYVVEKKTINENNSQMGAGEIIVSSGGGRLGEDLLRTALNAHAINDLNCPTWRLLAGHNLPDSTLSELSSAAPDGVVVERSRRDFVTLLNNCRLSISQGGYNTIMEVLQAGAPAVAVPYAGGNETEQTMRTQLLADRGLLKVVREDELSPENLATAAAAALAGPKRPEIGINMDGAVTSAKLIETWLVERAEKRT